LNAKQTCSKVIGSAWRKTHGTEIIEFAVSLPLLVVLVVGVYDFGSAFTLKHKLTSAVREGARVAASQLRPIELANTCGAPISVCAIRDTVHSSLTTSNVNDCDLGTVSGTVGMAGTFIWTFNGSCSGMSLKIERDVLNPDTGTLAAPFDTSSYHVENTKITLVYPYQWQFNQAFKLLDRNANYLSSTITVSATMQNME
jgi:hypothetical protein